MGGSGHGTIVEVGTDTIKIMVVIDGGRGTDGRRGLEDGGERRDGRGDGGSNGLVEKSIELARGKRGGSRGCRRIKVRSDETRVTGKVEELVVADVERVVVRAGRGIRGVFNEDVGTRE